MEPGEVIGILSRLILGAAASFLGIMLWSRTRDAAWVLIIIAAIMSYVETVYSILRQFGMEIGSFLSIGTVPVLPIILSSLSMAFTIAAFSVMVVRKYRHFPIGNINREKK
jgi:glucan phosphoethanolaminetransferase (alkaline phosphatase superfamily)